MSILTHAKTHHSNIHDVCVCVCGCGLLSFPQFINSTAWQVFIQLKLHLPALISELWNYTHTLTGMNVFCVKTLSFFSVTLTSTNNYKRCCMLWGDQHQKTQVSMETHKDSFYCPVCEDMVENRSLQVVRHSLELFHFTYHTQTFGCWLLE